MSKISPKIYLALTTAISGLFCGCYEGGDIECFSTVELDYISSVGVDSVHFYINDEQVCVGEKGVFSNKKICAASIMQDSINGTLYDSANCFRTEGYYSWDISECFVSERNYGESLNDFRLTLRVFYEQEEKNIGMDMAYHSKNRYIIVSEQDTTRWLAERSLGAYILNKYTFYDWKRVGCFDGFCVSTLPLSSSKASQCYDRAIIY